MLQNLQKLDIEDVNITILDKTKYRKILVAACHNKNKQRLLKSAKGRNKCDRILNEEYGKKYYFFEKNIDEARFFFKTRVSMLPFAANYPNDKTNWLCLCGVKEEEKNLTSGNCSVFGDLVDGTEN